MMALTILITLCSPVRPLWCYIRNTVSCYLKFWLTNLTDADKMIYTYKRGTLTKLRNFFQKLFKINNRSGHLRYENDYWLRLGAAPEPTDIIW